MSSIDHNFTDLLVTDPPITVSARRQPSDANHAGRVNVSAITVVVHVSRLTD